MAEPGLLLDWGGVMTTDLRSAFARFCVEEGVEPDRLRMAFRHDRSARDALIAYEEGRMGDEQFSLELTRALGLREERAEGLVLRILDKLEIEPVMVEAVRAVRAAGVRTVMVSNSWGEGLYPDGMLEELFDDVVISGKEGIRKPHPRMYELGAQRAARPPEACVFVDDMPFNLEPARELGMTVIHHTDPRSTLEELGALLGVPLHEYGG